MLERLALAIFHGELEPGGGGHILLPFNIVKDKYIVLARAALTVLREPDAKMETAGSLVASLRGPDYDVIGPWQAMIDAALEPDD